MYTLTALDEFGRTLMGRILGPMKGSSTYRIRYNNKLYKQSEEPNISSIIKLKRPQWQVTSSVRMKNAYRTGFWKVTISEKGL
jgi:hypothetical protein